MKKITPIEFRRWLADHGYTQRGFAQRCGIDERRVRSWLAAERKMPILLPIVLELLAKERVT